LVSSPDFWLNLPKHESHLYIYIYIYIYTDDRSPFWLQTKIPIETTGTPPVFLSGKCSLHFDLKKYDPIILKGFFMKQNGPDSPDFKGKKIKIKIQTARFL
jgi:hypothetical protein